MTGVAFLSEEWLALQCELDEKAPPVPGATAKVQHHVTGGPSGAVAYVDEIVDGRIVASRSGVDEDADVVLTAPHDLAVQLATGEVDPSVAFMQGRLKMSGDMGRLLAVLPLTRDPERQLLVEQLVARTDF